MWLLTNPKQEIRNSKQIQNSNFQMSKTAVDAGLLPNFCHLDFVIFQLDFVI